MTATTGAARTARRAMATSAGAGIALLALVVMARSPAIAAVVDPVPLPHLRPGNAPAAKRPPMPGQPVVSNQPLTQQQILVNISNYFNSFRTMEGQFVQVGPNGEQSEGVFFMARPGKIRFHYRPPVRLDVIADGHSVAVKDLKARTQDLYPLSKTPLRYLLADHTDFTTGNVVRNVRVDRDAVSIVLVEASLFSEGQLTLIFDRNTYELKQWIVTDAQGLNTSVAIYNVTLNKPADPGNFQIEMSVEPGK